MTLPSLNIDLFLLVFMRMSGAIIFNPIFGRSNIPATLKGALSLVCAYLVTSTLGKQAYVMNNMVQFGISCTLELVIGIAIGTIISGLFSVVLVAGEMVDLQMGFSMANFYDPKSGVNMPIIGSFFNAILILVFFASNAHLTLFNLLTDSFRAIPAGTGYPTLQSAQFIVSMGKDIFEMGIRFAIPILAVEIIAQIMMGILMRAVPQINIFTVGIQLQTIIGIVMLLIAVPVIVTLNGRLSDFTIEKITELIKLMIHT
jgi:flagellar biosynthetic protein FliR